MVKMILLIFAFNANILGLTKFPSNKEIDFNIVSETEIYNGISKRKYVVDGVNISDFEKEDVLELIHLLNSEEYDFSANIILYAYSNRNAASLFGAISPYLPVNKKQRDEMISYWRSSIKDNDIRYWKEWVANQKF
jgi:hypothetical protein